MEQYNTLHKMNYEDDLYEETNLDTNWIQDFETTDKNYSWDGIYKDKELSGAIFVYYCKGKYTDGKEFKQNGDVTLVK